MNKLPVEITDQDLPWLSQLLEIKEDYEMEIEFISKSAPPYLYKVIHQYEICVEPLLFGRFYIAVYDYCSKDIVQPKQAANSFDEVRKILDEILQSSLFKS